MLIGLLLVTSLALSALSTAEIEPGVVMTMIGLMILLGFAELMDGSQHNFVIALRIGGSAIALFGLVLQVL